MTRKEAASPSFWILTVATLLLLVCAIYYPVLFGKVPLPANIALRFAPFAGSQVQQTELPHANIGDLITQAYPFRAFAAQRIRDGILPLWNPYILSGSPFIANAQSAVFYPFNWIAVVLPLPTAWGLGLILRMFLAGFFMVLFIRAIGGSKTGSLASGILFAACGFLTAWQGWAIGDAAIWLPLICYGVHRLHETLSNAALVITAVAFAMPVLAGHPETAAHLTLTGIFLAATLWASDLSERKWRLDFVIRFSVAGFVALGLAAIQLLPTLEWIQDLIPLISTPWPTLQPAQLFALVSRDILSHPNSAGLFVPESAAYLGMVTLPAAALSIFYPRRTYVVFFFLLTIISGCAAYGVGPVHAIVASTPVLQGIKNSRLILVMSFGLISLAGLGISSLEGQHRLARGKTLFVLGVGGLFTSGLVYALHLHTARDVAFLRSAYFSGALLAASVAPIVLKLYDRLKGASFPVLVCVIVLVDLATFSYGYTGFADPKDIFPSAPLFDFLAEHDDPNLFRIAGLSDPYPINATMIYRIPTVDGYDIPLERNQIFTRGLRPDRQVGIGLSENGVLRATDRRLDLLNVKYLVTTTQGDGFEIFKQREKYGLVFQVGKMAVFENKTVLPRAFAVPTSGIEVIENFYDQLARLRESSFRPERSIILSAPLPSPDSAPVATNNSFTSEIVNTTDKESVSYRTSTSEPAILIISQTYYPGWRAMVDGNPAPVIPVDLALTGIPIPAGKHEVRFTLHPSTFYLGAALTVMALLSLACLPTSARAARIFATSVGVLVVGSATILIASHFARSSSIDSTRMVIASTLPLVLDKGDASRTLVSSEEVQAGYADFESSQSSGLSALALVKYSESGEVDSETGMPSQPPGNAGVIPFRLDKNYNTAVAMTNRSNNSVTLTVSENSAREISQFDIPPRGQISVFVDEAPFRVRGARGQLAWRSSSPILVEALLTYRDETHPFVLANTPVGMVGSADPLYLPYAPSAARSKELTAVNPTANRLTGSFEWYSAAGRLMNSVRYAVPPWSANVYTDATSFPDASGGWIRVAADNDQLSPQTTLTCLLESKATVSLVTLAAARPVTEARIYAEVSDATRTAIAIANPNSTAVRVNIGEEFVIGSHQSRIVPAPRGGVLSIASSQPVALSMLRNHSNDGTEHLSSAYPADLRSDAMFAHFTAGGFFTTDIVLFGAGNQPINGTLRLFSPGGASVELGRVN